MENKYLLIVLLYPCIVEKNITTTPMEKNNMTAVKEIKTIKSAF